MIKVYLYSKVLTGGLCSSVKVEIWKIVKVKIQKSGKVERWKRWKLETYKSGKWKSWILKNGKVEKRKIGKLE